MQMDPGDGDWTLRGKYFGWSDVGISVVCAAALLIARPIFIRLFFRPFALMMKELDPQEPLSPKVQEEVQKFCKYCWHTMWYTIFWIWALALYLPMPWAFDVDQVWASYPHSPEGQLPFKTIFLVEAGFYIHGFVESLLHDSKRTDFVMIVAHHVVAACLIFGCLWGNAHRAGLTILVEQDIGDIVIYIGKILHQCSLLTSVQSRIFHTSFLGCVAVTWFTTRVVALGLLVHRGWIYGLDLVPGLDTKVFMHVGALLPGHPEFDSFSMALAILLTLLLAMQVVWCVAIFWMFFSQLFQGTFHDFILDPESKKSKNASPAPAVTRRSSSPKRPGAGAKKIE